MVLFTLPVQAKRIALVMGNDNYTSVSKLQKAGNDATAMARELKNAGFTVQLHKDLNYRGMVRAVEAFTNNITGGDEVVVFFAGHGVQIRNGSYLLPTDIEANSESEVEKTAYELLALTDKISEAKPAFSLVMVDACRDNPLKSKGRNIGNARGLSAIEPPKGQMVVYSASRGQQALDRLSDKDPNPNGVFTREFITQMKKPGVRIEDIMRSVQDSVETLAKSVSHEQRPAVYNEARGNFYFFGPTTVQAVPQVPNKPDPTSLELAMWDGVKNATTVAEIQAYLNRFSNGFFSELARARIVALGGKKLETATAFKEQRDSSEVKSNDVEMQLSKESIEENFNKVNTTVAAIAASQDSSLKQSAPQVSDLKNPGTIIKDCDECPEIVLIPSETIIKGIKADRITERIELEDNDIILSVSSTVRKNLSDLANVKVNSYNKVVLLTGEVSSEAEKEIAGRLAKAQNSVTYVVNELVVQPKSTWSQRSKDIITTGQIRALVMDASDLQSKNFKVITERGVVYLMGRVTTREAQRAYEVARSRHVNGVFKVVRLFEIITEAELYSLSQPKIVKP